MLIIPNYNTFGSRRVNSGGGGLETKFVIEVTIDDTDSSGDRDFDFRSQGPIGLQNYNIDWGDGNSDTGITTINKVHTYSANGVYDIKVDGVFGIDFRGIGLDKLKVTKLKNWGTNEAQLVSLYQAFYGCTNMVYEATDYPDLTNLDATNPNNLFFNNTFRDCNKLGRNADLSNWQNLNVITRAQHMFSGLRENPNINISGWDTSNMLRIGNMFVAVGFTTGDGVITAQNLDLTALDGISTSNRSIFENAKCTSIDVSGWTFNPATTHDFFRMFKRVRNLPSLDLSTWTNCKINLAQEMFAEMYETQTLNISNIDFSSCTSFRGLFNNNEDLTTITGLNEMSSSSVTNMRQMFRSCRVLQFTDTSNFDNTFTASSNTTLYGTFENVGVTTPTPPPNISQFDTSNVTEMYQTFQGSKFTSTLDLSGWDFSSATTMFRFMYLNDGITSIDATNWNISSALTNMQGAFRQSDLQSITFGSTSDFSGVTTFQNCFQSATSIASINFPNNADFSSVVAMTNFLSGSTQGMTIAEYDNFLLRFDATNSNAGMTLNMGTCQYTAGGAVAAARANIIARGNTITDGGGVFTNTYSLAFDGVDDYVSMGNPTSLQITGELTLSCWVKISGSTGSNQGFIYKDAAGAGRSYKLQLQGSTNLANFTIFNGGTAFHTYSTSTINDGNWHHIVAVYTPSTSVVVYVDGVAETTNTSSVPASIDNDPVPFELGRRADGVFYLQGSLDEVAVFNTALTSGNVTSIYNSGVPNDLTSLNPTAWYRMGD